MFRCWGILMTLLVSQVSQSTAQTTIPVSWDFNINEPINATVGDTLEFTWPRSGFHDIYIHPTGNCFPAGAIQLYSPPTTGGTFSYTLTPDDGAPGGNRVFFACEVGEGVHCEFNVNQVSTSESIRRYWVPFEESSNLSHSLDP